MATSVVDLPAFMTIPSELIVKLELLTVELSNEDTLALIESVVCFNSLDTALMSDSVSSIAGTGLVAIEPSSSCTSRM